MNLEQWIETNARVLEVDIRRALDRWPAGVPGLRDAIVDGRMHGGDWYGPCACLAGTLIIEAGLVPCLKSDDSVAYWRARSNSLVLLETIRRGARFPDFVHFLPADSDADDEWSLFEVLVENVKPGDTPETSPALAFTLAVVDRWIDEQAARLTVPAEPERVMA